MSLEDRLKAEIAQTGPMPVSAFMARCLFDPEGGYYATRPRLGPEGDFITAPLVSQMFGEMLGLWAAETWTRLGQPPRVLLVEMGPGDGTLMSDVLRAARLVPEFLAAAELWLVELSQPLRAAQAARLADAPLAPRWADALSEVPSDAPLILLSNELLDCLPTDQFVRAERGWAERRVGLSPDGELAFGLTPGHRPADAPEDLAAGLVWEVSPAQAALGAEVGARIAAQGGAALFIDYGRDRPEPGDTLQALKAHTKISPLETPGEADLTVWADFPAFAAGARSAGAQAAILTQGALLRRLGIEQRAATLARARPDRAETLARQLARLVDPAEMGTLFKACAVHAGPVPPGFEETS
ncbi:class I SAM-dependent methyltransferase [Caulobacter sp. 17J80-11]|uniref:class I SAM-dependent methyltransferase n=1 Tax=Caulobacter sp. 17J80-11 TaxID=2763502 RepID=UPI00165392E0|nr:SAM-dependent methyltransferase [Caulobacter sp. 17J80-11]MBC6982233.1 SAM-dependent methyltransferase [Caulobacter sp. 17J80-11]